MVAGDINKDGEINTADFQAIRDSASMSFAPRFSLRGYGIPANGTERQIVDNNFGKVSSLRKFANISADLGIVYDDTEEGGIINPDDQNARTDARNNEIAEYRSKKIQESYVVGIDYIVSATSTINGNYVDVALYIQNVGDDFALANCSFPIKYDPTVVSFNSLISDGVKFSSGTNTFDNFGYSTPYFAPTTYAVDPVPNTYSIEINFNARTEFNYPGRNVSRSNPDYLGTLRFNLLRNDESIFFD